MLLVLPGATTDILESHPLLSNIPSAPGSKSRILNFFDFLSDDLDN